MARRDPVGIRLPSRCFATGGMSPRHSCTPSTSLELDSEDLRREPIEVRKATLASVLTKSGPGVRLNEHMEREGDDVFSTPARWVSRGLSKSGWDRATGRAARRTG